MKRFTILLLMLLITSIVNAQINKLTAKAGMTYNVVDFNWSIAGNLNGQSPNVLSELNFKKIKSFGYFVSGTYPLVRNINIIGYYELNTVVGGNGTDIDYKDDNRMSPMYIPIEKCTNIQLKSVPVSKD